MVKFSVRNKTAADQFTKVREVGMLTGLAEALFKIADPEKVIELDVPVGMTPARFQKAIHIYAERYCAFRVNTRTRNGKMIVGRQLNPTANSQGKQIVPEAKRSTEKARQRN